MTERIYAVALLTRSEAASLGPTFERLWPIDETPCFTGLLTAIDEADRQIWRERDANHTQWATKKAD